MPIPAAQAAVRPPLLRLAGRIRDQLLTGRSDPPSLFLYALDNLTSRLTELSTVRHRWDLCQRHHLHLAAAKMQEELQVLLMRLPEEADQVTRQMPPGLPEHPLLPLPELVKELEHLEEEFGPWRYDKDSQELIVPTEPIVLEDRNFGPFEIRLALDRLGRQARNGCYKVVALEPHPPTSNDSVTHPHVSDDHLCEGEASAPIMAALTEGRLADFFILVRCVLNTYNPGSPYVSLDNWEGIACHDCGSVTSDDDTHYCEACNHDYCSECMSYCRTCDDSSCSSCLEECPACTERVCADCLETCDQCAGRCCKSCLEEGMCPECREKAKTAEPITQGVSDETESNTPGAGGNNTATGKSGGSGSVAAKPGPVVPIAQEPARPTRRPRARRTSRTTSRPRRSRTRPVASAA